MRVLARKMGLNMKLHASSISIGPEIEAKIRTDINRPERLQILINPAAAKIKRSIRETTLRVSLMEVVHEIEFPSRSHIIVLTIDEADGSGIGRLELIACGIRNRRYGAHSKNTMTATARILRRNILFDLKSRKNHASITMNRVRT